MKSFNLSDWALGHRSLVWYFMIAFMAAGLFAYLQLGRQEDPDFTIKTMVIQAQWPGASPEEMTRQVTDRIEKKLEELESLDYTKSVTVARPDHGLRLSARHDQGGRRQADLGQGPQHDCGHQGRLSARGDRTVLQRSLRRRVRQYLRLYQRRLEPAPAARQVEDIRAKILTVPDVGKVDILGAQDEVIYLEFSTRKIAALGLDVRSIMTSLAGTKRGRAIRRVPGRSRAHQRTRERPVHVGGKPEGGQSPHQRPLLSADRRRDHHARLCRSAARPCSGTTASPRSRLPSA